jgi:uncharacterized protein (DUF2062 family)
VARNRTWLADKIRAALPKREELEANRWVRPVAHLLLRPALWRFTRRSVPRAIGLGLFVGIFMMIPFVQFVGAALMAVPFRANVPLTAGTTLLTNPVTTPAIMIAAIWVGSAIFGIDADPGAIIAMARDGASLHDWEVWLMSAGAPALILGLFIIGAVSGLVGYVAAGFIWRWWIAHKWRQRYAAHHPEG